MEEFVQNYCTCETDNKTKHIVEHHVTEILTNTLRPIFKKQITSHRTLTRRPEAKYASVADDDLHEDQLWKSENYVDILIWIVRNVSVKIFINSNGDGMTQTLCMYRQKTWKKTCI